MCRVDAYLDSYSNLLGNGATGMCAVDVIFSIFLPDGYTRAWYMWNIIVFKDLFPSDVCLEGRQSVNVC